MTDKSPDQAAKTGFPQQLRNILVALYDPLVLGNSPLGQCLSQLSTGASSQPGSLPDASIIRQTLIDAIEALKPAQNTPGGIKSTRVYEILRHRFIEQQTQRTVADTMNLSIRQIQREEKTAIEILGDALWRTYHLELKAHLFTPQPAGASDTGSPSSGNPLPETDVEWENLISSMPYQKTNIMEVVQDAADTMKPYLDAAQITVTCQGQNASPNLYMQPPLLRQGLLNLINIMIDRIPQGLMDIQTTSQPGEAHIRIKAWSASGDIPTKAGIDNFNQENLDIARKLINLCKGKLLIDFLPETQESTGRPVPVMSVEIDLSAAEQIMVLVVEDHADTVQLYHRYLAESRYQLLTANDIRRGLSLAQENLPKIIILDVMMPESDGWALLSQLRVHPKTQNIPVIICSIIPQSKLALSLGAAGFLQKPVKRVDLLSALDYQMDQIQTKLG